MATATGDQGLLDIRHAGAPGWRLWYNRNERFALGLLGFVSITFLWQMMVTLGFWKLSFMSSPERIWSAAGAEIVQGRIWGDLSISFQEFALGYFFASVVGIAIGIAGGWYRRVNYIIDPWISAMNATPSVALVPLIILILGIGLWSKVFFVALETFFSVVINTLVGVLSTEGRFLEVSRSFGASKSLQFRSVVLPGSIPFILTGLRIGAGRALVGVVVAELIAANAGIGFMITIAGATLNSGRLMLGIVILGVFGVLLGEVMRRIERKFDVWRPVTFG
jgi:ABC-type nitrate/sulfonate/bicarbonate transport system permease component